MQTLLKSSFQQRRAWWLAVFLVWLCRPATAQVVVSNYPSFLKALQSGTGVINQFVTNSLITLTTSGETIQITNHVFIDGGTNGIVFDGSGVTRIFTVGTNGTLTLNNLQIIDGISTNGGAIYNNGTLIISNCIISGNAATNISGVDGTTNTSGGNGGSAGSGGSAAGGAIYSRGPVSIYYSIVGTNSAIGGNGGVGGPGSPPSFGGAFGGNGGNAGSGGSAFGAAVFSSGSNNVFVDTEFFGNACTAGSAGSGGGSGGGAFAASGGKGAPGGAAEGGAVYVTGSMWVTNCVFAQNSTKGGDSGADEYGDNGAAGGLAEGGGLYIPATETNVYLENTVFFDNTCTGGAGAAASGGADGASVYGGAGGSALGGGLASAAPLTILRNCTLATNLLAVGSGGSGTRGNGTVGDADGWDICRTAGLIRLSGSIISGGTNSSTNTMPNAYYTTDAGYNVSSDSSLLKTSADTITNADPGLDSALAQLGGPSFGPEDVAGPVFLTLDIVAGSIAIGSVYGVPGLSFPATDQLGSTRGSPASAGAYEYAAITIDSNATPADIDVFLEPTNQIANVGDTVTFMVAATNLDAYNNPLGYQWQLNGTNLTDNATFNGSATTNLTVKHVSDALQGPYQVIVSPSLLETAWTSSIVSVIVLTPLKITTQPVSQSRVPAGSVVTFSVGAAGTTPVSYQWFEVTTNLGTNILSGSTNSILTIDPADFGNEGSYFVTVTDRFSSTNSAKVSLSVVPDTAKPSIKISSPALGARTNNSTFSGTASDNAQVLQVNYWVTNVNAGIVPARTTQSGTAILGTNGTTTKTWSVANALLPGTNYITVQSVDYSGNISPFARSEFFYRVGTPFRLFTSPKDMRVGGVADIRGDPAPSNEASLYVGEGYVLTAQPANYFWLTNWTVNHNVVGTNPTLAFIMESNLEITVNYKTNLFVGAAARYDGIFYPSSPQSASVTNSGLICNLVVGTNGVYSGKLYLASASPYSISGSFNTSGYAAKTIDRSAADGGDVTLELNLLWTNELRQIAGQVQTADWNSTNLNLYAATTGPIQISNYTLLMPPDTNATDTPPGYGYALVTNIADLIHAGGALADGTVFTALLEPVNELDQFPVYASLYNNKGLLLGQVSLDAATNTAVTAGTLLWFKPSASTGLYRAGFTANLDAAISVWSNSLGALAAFTNDTQLTLAGGGLSADMTNIVQLTSSNTFKLISGSNYFSGSVKGADGLLTVTFTNSGGSRVSASGVILQNLGVGGGFFVGATNAGVITLTP